MSLSCILSLTSTGFVGGDNLTGVFSGEGNVAVADLSNPRELMFEHEGSSIRCGWAYTAEVVQSLSGDARSFDFALTSAEKPLRLGRYLVFVDKAQAGMAGGLTASQKGVESDLTAKREECWQRLGYFTHPDLKMVFPIAPGTGDEKVRGPTTGRSVLETLGVESCGTDAHGPLFCVNDVREAIRAITVPVEVPAHD